MQPATATKQAVLILNVDDNDGARYVKTRILQGAGFAVAEAANGTDALALAKSLLPSLVLLDVKLPDINGLEVCRRIKADMATCSVLVLQTSAALTGRDDKIRGLEGGADNYLAAPIEADELIANVNALLRLQRTQADLRNSEERFRQLTDNIEDVFWMFALHSNELLFVSRAYDAMWQRSRLALEEAPHDWLRAVHADDRTRVEASWKALPQDLHFEQEYRLCQGDGVRWVRDRAFLVRDASNNPYRIARITSDITLRKEMEDLLRRADDNKNDFLATLAHELRNPLSPIRSAVALIGMQRGAATPVQEKALQVIDRQVSHLSRLVDDLLDVARISEGKLTLRMQHVELRSVLEPAIETAKPMLEARGHTLAVQLPPQPIWLNGDPVRLAQAIGNILHNAAKFTNLNGNIELTVTLPEPARMHIAVHDNGIGITNYNLPRIFNMFTQGAYAHDRTNDGLGIGLPLVSTLAQMHGGLLRAESPGIDQGSTFTIELPVLPPLSEDAPARIDSDGPLAGRKRTMLLIDDNIDSAEILANLLSAHGHRVHVAHDPGSVLSLARSLQPDVIMLDIGLPRVDGYQLARMLRAEPAFSTIKLIAHTGFGSPEDRRKTTQAGFDHHLVKPADLEELKRILEAL
jgi:signal transduction histidine kinase